MNPKHINNITDPKRIAHAPYNFVELPEKVVEAELPLPDGDRYHPNKDVATNKDVENPRYTGRIECTLTTESPLYTRCGWTREDFAKYGDTPFQELPDDLKEKRANFFINLATNQPMITGSSIRGMLRTLVEIVSFSKIERVSDEHRLFFRAVASNPNKESWGKEYKRYVEPKKIKAGYLKKDNQGWYIQPAKSEQNSTFAWVRETSLNLLNFKKFTDTQYKSQYISVSYETLAVDYQDIAKRLFAHNVESPNTYPNKGVLVTSGNMKQGNQLSPRRNHCVVFAEDKNATRLQIDETAIAHYRNALTDFQKESPFDKDWGVLQEQENRPVFYCPPEKGNVVGFFGQSPNFRIPYSPQGNGHAATVVDFIPDNLRKLASIDLADAIFGWVKKETKEEKLPDSFEKQRAGRVFFTDGLYQSSKDGIWYQDRPLTPQILSGPKPTCFPHYLVQPEEDNPDANPSKLKHYASQPVTETVIRGHKLYWHKGSDPDFKQKKVIGSTKKESNTQTTQIKPIKKGVIFKFNIHFENLTQVELGALLWVLSLSSEKSTTIQTGKKGEQYSFSLGMGKPLGMGAVTIEYDLHLSDRVSRYEKLFCGDSWNISEDLADLEKERAYIQYFEKFMLDAETGISENDHPDGRKATCLKEVPRIEMLLAMLRWDKTPEAKDTRYMTIDAKEYQNRPVLPTPLQIAEIEDCRRIDNIAASASVVPNLKKDNKSNYTCGQIVNAKVLKIEPQKKGVEVTYEIECSKEELLKRKEYFKGNAPFTVKENVKLKVPSLKDDGKIQKVKWIPDA